MSVITQIHSHCEASENDKLKKETEGKINAEGNKDEEEKAERRERKCDGEIRREIRGGMRDGEEGKKEKLWEWRKQMKKIWRERLEMKKEN